MIGLGSIDRSLQKRRSGRQTIHSPPPPACPGHGTKGPGCIQFAFPSTHPTLPHPRIHAFRSIRITPGPHQSAFFISAFNTSPHYRITGQYAPAIFGGALLGTRQTTRTIGGPLRKSLMRLIQYSRIQSARTKQLTRAPYPGQRPGQQTDRDQTHLPTPGNSSG